MIREIGLLVWLTGLGWAVLALVGLTRSAPRPAMLMAPLAGLVTSTVLTAVVVVSPGARPMWVLACLGVAVVARAALGAARHGTLLRFAIGAACSVSVAVVALVALYWALGPVLTFDSYRFVLQGRALRGNRLDLGAAGVSDFPLLVTHVQAIARAIGDEYSTYAAGVAASLALVGAVDLVLPSFGLRARRRSAVLLASTAAMAVVVGSVYMLRVQLVYLNSHLVTASLFTGVVALCVAAARLDVRWPYVMAAGGFAAGITLARVEGLVFVPLLVVFFADVVSPTRREALMFGATALAPGVLWYGALVAAGSEGDILSPVRSGALLLAACGAVAISMLHPANALRRHLPAIAMAGLCVALVGLLFVRREHTAISLSAMARNAFVDGLWGPWWWMIVPMMIVTALVCSPRRTENAWQLVTVGYVVVVACLGGLRQIPYRLGWGDSANRMLVHVAPVLAISLALRLFGDHSREPARLESESAAR